MALAIADTEGFDAVSIRRVAAELGAGTMSLYRYISAKSDLVALMDDAIMGESPIPGGQLPADGREALTMIAQHRTVLRTVGPACAARTAGTDPVRRRITPSPIPATMQGRYPNAAYGPCSMAPRPSGERPLRERARSPAS